jgi:hypothetical protein
MDNTKEKEKEKENAFMEELTEFIVDWCKDNDMPPFTYSGEYTGSYVTIKLEKKKN